MSKITNEERRAAAARLRGLDEATATLSPEYSRQEYDAMVLRAIRAVVGEGDIFHLLADLIDRPTCHDTGERVNSFTCSYCGFYEEKIVFNPFTYSFRGLKPDWNYCPNCGAEVVE